MPESEANLKEHKISVQTPIAQGLLGKKVGDTAEITVPQGKVSVVIPSKDNPRVLSNCIHSVMEASTWRDFEIIVVDNGSSAKNRKRIERMRDMMQPQFRFLYHYEL